jgi:hypothetical protein
MKKTIATSILAFALFASTTVSAAGFDYVNAIPEKVAPGEIVALPGEYDVASLYTVVLGNFVYTDLEPLPLGNLLAIELPQNLPEARYYAVVINQDDYSDIHLVRIRAYKQSLQVELGSH